MVKLRPVPDTGDGNSNFSSAWRRKSVLCGVAKIGINFKPTTFPKTIATEFYGVHCGAGSEPGRSEISESQVHVRFLDDVMMTHITNDSQWYHAPLVTISGRKDYSIFFIQQSVRETTKIQHQYIKFSTHEGVSGYAYSRGSSPLLWAMFYNVCPSHACVFSRTSRLWGLTGRIDPVMQWFSDSSRFILMFRRVSRVMADSFRFCFVACAHH